MHNMEIEEVRRRSSTSTEEVARFQSLFPNPRWLTQDGHQKLISTFPWMDNCLSVTKRYRLVVYIMLLGGSRPHP